MLIFGTRREEKFVPKLDSAGKNGHYINV